MSKLKPENFDEFLQLTVDEKRKVFQNTRSVDVGKIEPILREFIHDIHNHSGGFEGESEAIDTTVKAIAKELSK